MGGRQTLHHAVAVVNVSPARRGREMTRLVRQLTRDSRIGQAVGDPVDVESRTVPGAAFSNPVHQIELREKQARNDPEMNQKPDSQVTRNRAM